VSKLMRWKDGKTAPRNGNHFIANDPICGLLFTMHWDGKTFLTADERWSGQFTHWMPLPKPPRSKP
jgi:hypothetical protein